MVAETLPKIDADSCQITLQMIKKIEAPPLVDGRMIKPAITHREEPSDRIAVVEYVPSIFASVSRSRNASGKRDNPDNKPG